MLYDDYFITQFVANIYILKML